MKVRDILKLLADDGWFWVVPQEVTDSSNTGRLQCLYAALHISKI